MRVFLIALLLLTICFTHAQDRVQDLAKAIAKAEGFYKKGTLPNRCHNPGDIRARRGTHYYGQIGLNRRGYVIFRNDAAGWSALYRQIGKVISGESDHYTVNMTLVQFGKRYATSRIWSKNVSSVLGVTPSTSLWEILDVAPKLEINNGTEQLYKWLADFPTVLQQA